MFQLFALSGRLVALDGGPTFGLPYPDSPWLVGLHNLSDVLIGLCYAAISATLVALVYRGRRTIPFHWMFLAFGAFIIACGATHLMHVLTVWRPEYWWALGAAQAVTVVASGFSALLLPPLVPKALALVGSAQLSDRRRAQLEEVNAALRDEVAERGRAEAALRESREHFQAIFELAPIGMANVDATGRTIRANRALQTMLGYSLAELQQLNSMEFTHPDDVDESERLFRELVAGQHEQYRLTKRFRRKDGEFIWVELTIAAIRDAQGQFRHSVSMAEDITERRRAEEALQASEAHLRTILEATPIGMTIADADGRLRQANRAFRELLGYSEDELRGINFRQITHPDDVAAGARLHRELLDGTRDRIRREKRYHRKDGRLLWGNLTVAAVRDPAGKFLYTISMVEDITERKQAEEALRASEAGLAEAQRIAHLGSWDWDLAQDVMRWSTELYRIFGVAPPAFVPAYDAFLGLVSAEERERVDAAVQRALAGEAPYAIDYRIVRPDGTARVVHAEGEVRWDAAGRPLRMVGTAQDITERKRAEEALAASEARQRAVVDTAFDAIVTVTADGRIESFNRGAERIFGYAAPEVLGQPLALLMPERFRDANRAGMQRYFRGGESQVLGRTLELIGRRKDGEEFPMELSVAAVRSGNQPLFTGIFRDISERKVLEAQLWHQAYHDVLTDLPNRALFQERLDQALAQASRRHDSVAALFLDLDRFKVINDSLGHVVGDQLLVAVGQRLRGCVRSEDLVARLGGDEFMVLLEGIAGVGEATELAERIIAALQAPFVIDGHTMFTSTSIGIVLNGPGRGRAADVLRDVDIALYQAKARGKGHYAVFDAGMNERALERLALESDLRRALERGQIAVHYQPQIDLATGRLAGLEALARWEHPERGTVSPAMFIPLAEEIGLIRALDRRVLVEACRQLRAWRERYPGAPPVTLGVNLSARQFQHPELVDEVAAILRDTGLMPRDLLLELTESVVMEDAEANIAALRRLKELGVQLAIDDFGTGYSSLAYLKRFPVDILKIDHSFVAGLGRNPGDEAIVRAVIALAHTLGLRVIAEGVETAAQLAELRALGCALGQGYHFAKPLPPAGVEALLQQDFPPVHPGDSPAAALPV